LWIFCLSCGDYLKVLDIWAEFEKSGFFDAMRRKLKEKELENPEFKLTEIKMTDLISHLKEEIVELISAINWEGSEHYGGKLSVDGELVDVANMCGFLFALRKIKHNKK